MKTVVKHINGKIIGTENWVSGVDYASILQEDFIIIEGNYVPDFNKDNFIDETTYKTTSQDKPKPEKTAKQKRADAVRTITVTSSRGNVFNGDEISQDRMNRAIIAAEITGITSTVWKMANNKAVRITLAELKEAFALAIQEQARLWFLNY